jgi:hypothetical protein
MNCHVSFSDVLRASVGDGEATRGETLSEKGSKKEGRKYRLKCTTEGSTFSVLVPAQKPFRHRGCFEDDKYPLLEWFSKVEPLAWEFVNAHHCSNPPDKIFLVLEQKLTSGYSITHKATSEECEIELSARGLLPKEGEAKDYLGHNIEAAKASFGFEVQSEDDEEYVIFLTVRESFPIRRLKLERRSKLYARVQDMHRYVSCLLELTYGIDISKKWIGNTVHRIKTTDQNPPFQKIPERQVQKRQCKGQCRFHQGQNG